MEAFHGKEEIKKKYLTRVGRHIEADNLIRGTGWDGKRGCAVGCTLENYDHAQYEVELGIPEWLARVEDTLFENMSFEKSKTWPKVFLEAIHPGTDLEKAKTPFLIMILEHSLKSLSKVEFDVEKFPDVRAAIEGSEKAVRKMIRCHKEGADLSAARSAVWSAAESARSAAESAWSAAESARSAAESAWSAARSAWSAARSAVWSAARSAWSAARSAVWSAAESAWSAAESAWSAAESAAFDYYADQLLDILREIK